MVWAGQNDSQGSQMVVCLPFDCFIFCVTTLWKGV